MVTSTFFWCLTCAEEKHVSSTMQFRQEPYLVSLKPYMYVGLPPMYSVQGIPHLKTLSSVSANQLVYHQCLYTKTDYRCSVAVYSYCLYQLDNCCLQLFTPCSKVHQQPILHAQLDSCGLFSYHTSNLSLPRRGLTVSNLTLSCLHL